MNSSNTSVIICCAGMGTRLGIGSTKALVHLCGTPLIIRLLENLKDYDDIRIVVGYQADKVIKLVNEYRKDIMYVFNYDYESTGPAASMSKALVSVRENVIVLDGDLVVNPLDFRTFLNYQGECIPYSLKTSDEPITVRVEDQKVINFLDKDSEYEWPGMLKIKRENLSRGQGYIYEVLNPLLPFPTICLRTRSIDTQDDYDRTMKWIMNDFID